MRLFQLLYKRPVSTRPLYGFGDESLEQNHAKPKHWLFILLLALLFIGGYYQLALNKVLVEFDLQTDTRTVLKFYWPDDQGRFSERKMAQLLIKPGTTSYKLRVCDVGDMDYLRLDPSEKKARITIQRLTMTQRGYPYFTLHTNADFKNLQVISGVESLERHEQGITIQSGGLDPQLKLLLPAMDSKGFLSIDEIKRVLIILLLSIGCYFIVQSLISHSNFIPVLAAFVLALILVMAGVSRFNTHPDEEVHVAAGTYYQDHTLPPKIGDPAISHTYSAYGVSRLHSGEIVYPLVGKFLKILQPFGLESFLALRLFNVLLFASLVLYAFNKVDFRFFLLPFLISPQIWYVFSYFNSDAFATFIGLLCAYQFAAEKSTFTALLRGEHKKYSWPGLIFLGILIGLLLMQKQNFYFLYTFFFLYLVWKFWFERPVWTKKILIRLSAVVLIACSLVISFKGTDAWINDFNKSELKLEAREKYADIMYNPSTPIDQKHAYLQMRERGKPLRHFAQVDRWGEKTFRTSFGVYGYTSIPAPFSYYNYVRITTLLLLASLIFSVVYRGRLVGTSLLFISLGSCCLIVLVAFFHAWIVDFQAQGRYLLPVLPMLAVLLYHCQRILIRPVFFSLFFISFLLSVYNFIFVGLRDIDKYGM